MNPRYLAAAICAAGVAAVNLVVLAGDAYGRLAERRLDRPASPGTLAAAELAATLPPWSSRHRALLGWILATEGRSDAAHAAYVSALRLAPADAQLWSEYAQALARLGRFDAALARAVAGAGRLGPASPAVQRALADLGLSYWSRGGAELRRLWLDAMRYELDHSRALFLTHALTRGQGRTFCRDPARSLGEEKWCDSIASVLLGGCFTLAGKEPAPCNASQ